jgi:hypothetical protein
MKLTETFLGFHSLAGPFFATDIRIHVMELLAVGWNGVPWLWSHRSGVRWAAVKTLARSRDAARGGSLSRYRSDDAKSFISHSCAMPVSLQLSWATDRAARGHGLACSGGLSCGVVLLVGWRLSVWLHRR